MTSRNHFSGFFRLGLPNQGMARTLWASATPGDDDVGNFFCGELGRTGQGNLVSGCEPRHWLVVEPTHLKNISQNRNLPQIGMKIKSICNHHLGHLWNTPPYQQARKFIVSYGDCLECALFCVC